MQSLVNISLTDVFMGCVVGNKSDGVGLPGSLRIDGRVVVVHAGKKNVERLVFVLMRQAGIGKRCLISDAIMPGAVQSILQAEPDRRGGLRRALLSGRRQRQERRRGRQCQQAGLQNAFLSRHKRDLGGSLTHQIPRRNQATEWKINARLTVLRLFWQRNGKGGAAGIRASEFQFTAMSLGDPQADGESQAGSASAALGTRANFIGAEKSFENAWLQFSRNAFAGIANGDGV